jgi:hypothetical protein
MIDGTSSDDFTLGGMSSERMSVFGHRYLSLFFRPLVAVSTRGFRYKGRDYRWDDIRNVDVSDSPLKALAGYPAAIPRATITLSDGNVIRLNGRVLEKQGVKPKVGFFSSKSDAFNELVQIFRAHAA